MLQPVSAAVVLALAALPASAAPVVQANMTASAQMQVTGGALDGCGLRVIAVAQDGAATMTAVDFSFNFYRSGTSMVKAGVRTARISAPKSLGPISPITSFWLRTPGQPATSPDRAGIVKSESPRGYLLYGTAADSVAPLFGAAFDGRPIQVGFRLAGEDSDRILSGIVNDTGGDLKEVSQCLAELTDAMIKDTKADEAKGK